MTTDPFQPVREALHKLIRVHPFDTDDARAALAALDSIRDRYLPLEMLPEGWVLGALSQYDNYFVAHVYDSNSEDDSGPIDTYDYREEKGKTPNAAFIAAVKAIGGGK